MEQPLEGEELLRHYFPSRHALQDWRTDESHSSEGSTALSEWCFRAFDIVRAVCQGVLRCSHSA